MLYMFGIMGVTQAKNIVFSFRRCVSIVSIEHVLIPCNSNQQIMSHVEVRVEGGILFQHFNSLLVEKI